MLVEQALLLSGECLGLHMLRVGALRLLGQEDRLGIQLRWASEGRHRSHYIIDLPALGRTTACQLVRAAVRHPLGRHLAANEVGDIGVVGC